MSEARLTIQDVDVEEGNESKSPLAGVFRDVPLLNGQDMFDRVESDNFLEEVKASIADRGVGKGRDRSGAWPGNDSDEQNAEDDCTFDAVHHEHDRQDTT
jgi:hypothetical protein